MNNIFTSLQKKITRSTKQKQPDTSSISNSTNETLNSNSSKPTTNEPLTGTPFRIVHLPDHGWFVTLGMQRVTTEIYKTRTEATRPVADRDWNFICNVIVTLVDQIHNIQKTSK